MRASATILILLLVAGSAAAQSRQPDYSKDGLLRMFAGEPLEVRGERPVDFYVGAISFRALGSNFRFNYLPFMMPLSGTELDVTQSWPDPFSLTRTAIATSPRAWRTQRNVNAELRRIEKLERARVRVTTR